MSLKLSHVEHLAHLAKLELSEEERERLPRQLGEILGHFELLSALDTQTVPAYAGPGLQAPLREDQASEAHCWVGYGATFEVPGAIRGRR